jgi:hypothetical protein
MFSICVNKPLPPGDNPIAVNKYYYMLERFPTNNTRVVCTKKGIGKYGIMYST